jgi:hypothetical protein
MSWGMGHVQRLLVQLLETHPCQEFSTSELCEHIYGKVEIEKKHRVAVIRAIKALSRGRILLIWRSVLLRERTDDLWQCQPAVASYGTGQRAGKLPTR